MKTIWKFEIPDKYKTFSISMPMGAEILCVQVDQKTNTPCIWAMVDPGQFSQFRYFELHGIDSHIPTDIGIEREYIGTFQMDNGQFVGHLFERVD